MYKKLIIIIVFVITLIVINNKFKIKNYVTLNLIAKENNLYSLIDDNLLEKIIDKKSFEYKEKNYNFEIIKIDKNIINNREFSIVFLKTNIKYVENLSYQINIKIKEITLVDYIFSYIRGKI